MVPQSCLAAAAAAFSVCCSHSSTQSCPHQTAGATVRAVDHQRGLESSRMPSSHVRENRLKKTRSRTRPEVGMSYSRDNGPVVLR